MTSDSTAHPTFGPLGVTLPRGWMDESLPTDPSPKFTYGDYRLWIDCSSADQQQLSNARGRFLLEQKARLGGFFKVIETDDWAAVYARLWTIERGGQRVQEPSGLASA